MLADYLKKQIWVPVMQGVQMCKISCESLQADDPPVKKDSNPRFMTVFFCCEGTLLILRNNNPPMRIGKQEMLITSPFGDIRTLRVTEPVFGYLISIDEQLFLPRVKFLCQVFGNTELTSQRAQDMMISKGGCMSIHSTAWSRSAFSVLSSLPYTEQGRYCTMKILELFYLVSVKDAVLEGLSDLPPSLGYSARTIRSIRNYMEEHLDEKMTIPDLSRIFNISSTALKSGFREIYGQPVHNFLQEKRIEKASELLSFSRMTVLQIAEAVGYEGVSQFNLVFKRQYGVTPSQFRKMSEPMSF